MSVSFRCEIENTFYYIKETHTYEHLEGSVSFLGEIENFSIFIYLQITQTINL